MMASAPEPPLWRAAAHENVRGIGATLSDQAQELGKLLY
jgi:hypothetical protein